MRNQEYIEAARATGAGDIRLMIKYVLPNSLAPIIVQVSMGLATAILNISGFKLHRAWRPGADAGVGLHALHGKKLHP